QLAGDAVGPRTDLWGLGATLHEALTGRPPYHGATPVAIAEAQRSGSPPMPEVDPALAGVVGACLAPSPADRPLHAGAVADALRGWVAGRTDTAEALVPAALPAPAAGVAGSRAADTQAETRPVPIAAGAGPVPPPYGPAASPPSPRARPSLAWPALVALAAALALGGIAFALLGPRDGDGTAGPTPPPSPSPTPVATPLPTPTPTPVAAPVPGWATDLLDEFAERCGVASPLTAEQLVEMGRGEARDQMRELVDQCEDDGGGRGGGGGGGDDD
ncbi:MAG TPA: hypothetical protein VHK06_08590, partial [Candidatus Limnocylindria bacterium]|nr:hypothetical protein [Candidatus Limnocylindria bacterium]